MRRQIRSDKTKERLIAEVTLETGKKLAKFAEFNWAPEYPYVKSDLVSSLKQELSRLNRDYGLKPVTPIRVYREAKRTIEYEETYISSVFESEHEAGETA